MYYLQSRYYNPEWGRFINADAIAGHIGELLGHNIFTYCKNNPTTLKDDTGFTSVSATDLNGGMNNEENVGDKPVGGPISSGGISTRFNKLNELVKSKFTGDNSELGNGNSYSTLFEVQINGTTRSAHRISANKQFLKTMKENPDFAESIDNYFGQDTIKVMESGKSALRNPHEDWVWHHPLDDAKVMRLIPKIQHQSPFLRGILHPLPNGGGGFSDYYGD